MQDTVATGTSGYLQLNSGADEQSTSDRITVLLIIMVIVLEQIMK